MKIIDFPVENEKEHPGILDALARVVARVSWVSVRELVVTDDWLERVGDSRLETVFNAYLPDDNQYVVVVRGRSTAPAGYRYLIYELDKRYANTRLVYSLLTALREVMGVELWSLITLYE